MKTLDAKRFVEAHLHLTLKLLMLKLIFFKAHIHFLIMQLSHTALYFCYTTTVNYKVSSITFLTENYFKIRWYALEI